MGDWSRRERPLSSECRDWCGEVSGACAHESRARLGDSYDYGRLVTPRGGRCAVDAAIGAERSQVLVRTNRARDLESRTTMGDWSRRERAVE